MNVSVTMEVRLGLRLRFPQIIQSPAHARHLEFWTHFGVEP